MSHAGVQRWLWQEIRRRFDPERPAFATEFVDRPWFAVDRYLATIRATPPGTLLVFRATPRSGLTSLLAAVGRALAGAHAAGEPGPQTWTGPLDGGEAGKLWDPRGPQPVPMRYPVVIELRLGEALMAKDASELARWARAASAIALCDWGATPLRRRDPRCEAEVEVPDESSDDDAERWLREVFARRTHDVEGAAAAVPESVLSDLIQRAHGHVGNFVALVRACAAIADERGLRTLTAAVVRDALNHLTGKWIRPRTAERVPFAEGDGHGWRLAHVEVDNFRCFDHFAFDLAAASQLPGYWRCLCGINGAGKSTALQAIALAVLGTAATDLLRSRLKSLRRHGSDARTRVELTVTPTGGDPDRRGTAAKIATMIDPRGDLQVEPAMGEAAGEQTWRQLQRRLVVGYGANRNLSDLPDASPPLEPVVRRVFSLFEPFAHLASADALLRDSGTPEAAVADIADLASDLLGGQGLQARVEGAQLRFLQQGVPVDTLALPDGFRSTLAWMADLVVHWRQHGGIDTHQRPLAELDALVLIDEIDLHLHPSLQRRLIDVLRRRLPNVQWVVTTHSPLVLASFTRTELVALDVAAEGGIRPLDREILGWSADQVYHWLMGTRPHSVAFESVEQAQALGFDEEQIAQIVQQSPLVSAVEATQQTARRRELLAKLRGTE